MAKDLTTSRVDRQNILNNELALQEIQVLWLVMILTSCSSQRIE